MYENEIIILNLCMLCQANIKKKVSTYFTL